MPRLRRLLPVLLASALLALGCTEEPAAPVWNNPLDHHGPTGGDPFHVQANYSGNQVVVTWDEPQGPAIFSYQVLHALSVGGPFSVVGTADYGVTTYLHQDFAANAPNFYKVRALDRDDEPTALSDVAAAGVLVPPVLTREATVLAGRLLELTIAASVGDSVEVDSLPGFPAPARVALVDGTATLTWDAGAAVAQGEWKQLYARVLTAGAAGLTARDSIKVDFSPDLRFPGNPATLARRDTPLLVDPATGVTRMRFAADRAALAAAPWQTPADTVTDYLLAATPDTQLVFGEFESDLGLSWTDSVRAVPDPLRNLTLALQGGSATVSGPSINVQIAAKATQIRVAGSPEDLAATVWQDYAAPTPWTHDACASGVVKQVWAQVRNDWTTADALHDSITWLPPEALGLTFAGPDTVTAEAAVTLSGAAVAGTCTDPVDGVVLDVGDGPAAAAGLAAWTFPWTAPALTETTTVAVDWQVTAGTDSAAGAFQVVVVPR
ncbi:hypothetical protein KDK88_10115 [bacterium]|nr:hypothetical protein [bacterium]